MSIEIKTQVDFFKIGNSCVYSFKISDQLSNLNYLYSLLNTEEKIRSSKFHFQNDKESFIICRGILRSILSKHLLNNTLGPKNIAFSYNNFGKPSICIEQCENIYFNLSHSFNYCLIGISYGKPIGVDIEVIKPIKNMIEISERFFSKYENNYIFNQPEHNQLNSFYNIWSQKEALVKASGKGLSFGFESWSTKIPLEDYTILVNKKLFQLRTLYINQNYASAMCIIL